MPNFAQSLVTPLIGSLLLVSSATLTAQVQRSQSDAYDAIVEQSSWREKGEQIVIANVRAGRPIILWPSGAAEPTTRAFQDDDHVVLVFVAWGTGGTETFYLNTKTRRFLLIEVFLPSSTDARYAPHLTKGILRPR